eukprot:1487486-Pyramimonas_sp.AAC.1
MRRVVGEDREQKEAERRGEGQGDGSRDPLGTTTAKEVTVTAISGDVDDDCVPQAVHELPRCPSTRIEVLGPSQQWSCEGHRLS